jgi:hypothetical protein
MSSKSKKPAEEVKEETKVDENKGKVAPEEIPSSATDTTGDNEPAEEVEKIDPRVQCILELNRKKKVKESVKQAGIYSAMNKIKIVRK